ncbi:hypothetical protein EXIGLDRAFT_623616 [Exidia glandulosa HHB12029]|uniref:Amidohydrolase-related domain-containing protein n=1 Tax=Exidia glandulosa HHB12029 TaxID=1314781 RepID=A0A165DNA2_EXIGL|nr:hypothetical protein EXIGLDRAFT_623616 [Exidia glandulosa HHB12029]
MKGFDSAPAPRRALGSNILLLAALATCSAWLYLLGADSSTPATSHALPQNYQHILSTCASLHATPSIASSFHDRTESDRYVRGSEATWIRNASIWTGSRDGVVHGDVLLGRGLIKFVGSFNAQQVRDMGFELDKLKIVNANGAWVTPGIVDLHSHMGVDAAPSLRGADDTNSLHGITQPWLRSLDGINTHDMAYELSISGGVTTALIIPGSAGSIGGQGFTLKLRPTAERSPFSKLVEPPFAYNGSGIVPATPLRWRYLKQACGENPHGVYGATRMDSIWALRVAYNEARKVKERQDAYCAKVDAGLWRDVAALGEFPESLQWEALVDVLRGRVKIQTHCYEAVDFDGLVRLTNEFKFPIAAFHHAHEAYLVPDLLKKAYGSTPAIAMFATNARYKREAYRGSEFAPKILAENGIKVVMKSDHPVLNSRFLLYEAQQAHYYGLDADLALAAVTSTPAEILGLDHRLGFIQEGAPYVLIPLFGMFTELGYDADVVVWDSHPLSLGATPTQVYIDGIAQLKDPFANEKPSAFQKVPETPDFGDEAKKAVEYDGLPPLTPTPNVGVVAFTNVGSFNAQAFSAPTTIVVERGQVVCNADCVVPKDVGRVVDLKGGALAPGLVTFGAPLGLVEIDAESSTSDGVVHDVLRGGVPSILGSDPIIRAVDGLQFSGRSALLAYRSGVTHAISAPVSYGFISGLSAAVSLGAAHRLEKGAIAQRIVALHINIERGARESVSTRIAALRRLLLDAEAGGEWFSKAAKGEIPLVVDVANADIMATLLELKHEVDEAVGSKLRLVLARATEAYLLAPALARANVGVILVPSRPYPAVWDMARMLPGPPLTEKSAISVLLEHNVTVGLGIEESWSARNTRFDIAWAALESGPEGISRATAFALASSNLEKLLGVDLPRDIVAYEGGEMFSLSSKPVAVISSSRERVDLF